MLLRAVREELHADRIIYCVVALYCLTAAGVLAYGGAYDLAVFAAYVPMWQVTFAITLPAVFLSGRLAVPMMRERASASQAIAQAFSRENAARLVAGMVLMQFLLFFQIAFTSMKNAMPVFRDGFPYDKWQADFDQALHFGVDPVSFLHRTFGSDALTRVLEYNYSQIWFVVTFGCLFAFCVCEKSRARRTHFVLLFTGSWVLVGNIFACVFLSAGPIFYGNVTGDHERFASIAQYVFGNGSGGSFTELVQAYLWQMHDSGSTALGTGISAFPSVHVASTAAVWLAIRRINRIWGYVALCYLAMIQFSSVYLGWHYAIDGYFAIAVVIAGDWVLRRISLPNVVEKQAE